MYICICSQGDVTLRVPVDEDTANLRTKILDFRGFYSSRILI